MRVEATERLEIQIEPMRVALKQAQENVSQTTAQLAAERRSREQMAQALNEARAEVEKERSIVTRQRQALARMQDELVAARRAHEAQLAEQSARYDEQARLLVAAEAERKALEADLIKARMERECAIMLLAQPPSLRPNYADMSTPVVLSRAA